VALAKRILRAAVPIAAEPRRCGCGHALANAIVTAPDRIPASTRKRLGLLIGRYLKKP
jgi:5'-methylthioadenosine phosphorylase